MCGACAGDTRVEREEADRSSSSILLQTDPARPAAGRREGLHATCERPWDAGAELHGLGMAHRGAGRRVVDSHRPAHRRCCVAPEKPVVWAWMPLIRT
jgi:hypothetical protein